MLTYADVCWRMLTYADACWRMLTWRMRHWRSGVSGRCFSSLAYRCLNLQRPCFSSLAIAYRCLKRAGWGIPQAVYLRVGARNPWGTVWALWFFFLFFFSFSLFVLFFLFSLFFLFLHTHAHAHTRITGSFCRWWCRWRKKSIPSFPWLFFWWKKDKFALKLRHTH